MNVCLECFGFSELNFNKEEFLKKISKLDSRRARYFAELTSSTAAIDAFYEADFFSFKPYIIANKNISEDMIVKLAQDSDPQIRELALFRTPLGHICNARTFRITGTGAEILGVAENINKIQYLELLLTILKENATVCCELAAIPLIKQSPSCLLKLALQQGCASARHQIRLDSKSNSKEFIEALESHPEIEINYWAFKSWEWDPILEDKIAEKKKKLL